MEDPRFKDMTVQDIEQQLNQKSDIYKTMDKMIENLNRFREEYVGNREPNFKKSHEKSHKLLEKMKTERNSYGRMRGRKTVQNGFINSENKNQGRSQYNETTNSNSQNRNKNPLVSK